MVRFYPYKNTNLLQILQKVIICRICNKFVISLGNNHAKHDLFKINSTIDATRLIQ
jgi:hypothetical protein